MAHDSSTSTETGADHGQSVRLGVALSGGGVRAALFALGALTYLVDSRKCERVTEICSVSGGSITSAFVAERCDFRSVSRADFEPIAAQLAQAITSGLVSKRFVVATYGFAATVTLVASLITLSSWPFALPVWIDVALITAFGVLLLLRGTLLAYLFQRQLFGSSQLPSTLGSITSQVAHVFCATDLNASMPVYFTNIGRHFYSPAWGGADPTSAARIRVADAVRASAAFPGGVPPMRVDVWAADNHIYWVLQDLTGAAQNSPALPDLPPMLAAWPSRNLQITSDSYGWVENAYFRITAEITSVTAAAPVPEPASLLLFGSGLVGLRAWRRRRR